MYSDDRAAKFVPKTDRTKWKLNVENGRQTWSYNSDRTANQQAEYDRYFLGIDSDKNDDAYLKPRTLEESLYAAISFYFSIQTEDGHWADDYSGPMFLLPGLIFTCYITNTKIPPSFQLEMIHYLIRHVNADYGWGLHIESPSTMFGSVLSYVALRILGLPAEHQILSKSRMFIASEGGAIKIPHWGKFWLALLNLFDWDGVSAVLPELWSLPDFLPFHPHRFWCHCRVIYLPMSYLYGHKVTAKLTPLIKQLREEIYTKPYSSINWSQVRFQVHGADLYKPHSSLVKLLFPTLNFYDKIASLKFTRTKALKKVLDHIRYEDLHTNYIDIGPVNKVLNMLCEFHASDDGKSEAFRKHCEKLYDYLWMSEDGMKMQGYNGCQLWNTAFALQAFAQVDVKLLSKFESHISKAYEYIERTQVLENPPAFESYYRHASKGAWPFSTREHGWPISDCTAEGLKAALVIPLRFPTVKSLPENCLIDAVAILLSYQNKDGGWATYELQRSSPWLELLNPSECFGNIMIDYSYVECTSAAIKSLKFFTSLYPHHRSQEIKNSIANGVKFIKSIQNEDGYWIGSWAVCVSYGTWFAVTALVECDEDFKKLKTCEPVEKACDYLIAKQNTDGSWGEDFTSCSQGRWIHNRDGGHVVHTAWVCLTLMYASREKDKEVVKRGILWIVKNQKLNGDWKKQQAVGVFNANCAILYESYKNYFSIWAIARYLYHYKFSSAVDDQKLGL